MFVKRGKGMKKEVFDVTVYRDACALLQTKYGIPPYDYFVKNKNGQYSQRNQNNKKDKLEIHHIYEDKLPKLSTLNLLVNIYFLFIIVLVDSRVVHRVDYLTTTLRSLTM